MSFISSYCSYDFKTIPLPADQIITEQITFSDGSTLTSANTLTGVVTTGVYFTNANTGGFIPIQCSVSNLSNNLITSYTFETSVNYAFILMPGWSFILYSSASGGGTASSEMTNDTAAPICIYQSNLDEEDEEQNPYAAGTLLTGTDGVTAYAPAQALSIDIFYNEVKQTIAGIA